MTREIAINNVEKYFDQGEFYEDLARRIAIPSTSQDPDKRPALYVYLTEEIGPCLEEMGYQTSLHENPDPLGGPLLIADRHEGDDLTTVLTYGHGDVVRGHEGKWRDGRSPWKMEKQDDRWYGRGTADNKGQHSINIAALAHVLKTRGSLGFNSRILIETSEETGSAGLREFCQAQREALAADVLIGSDGPRLKPDAPTLFMGTRGAINFELTVNLREGGHHSGNWGGLLSSASIRLANAISSIVDKKGKILPAGLKPAEIPPSVRQALRGCSIEGGDGAPEVDPEWGEPGLTPAEQVFAWNSFEVLAMKAGDPEKVVNAVPPRATAWCQIRFTVDRDPNTFLSLIRDHLDQQGFDDVAVGQQEDGFMMQATRLLPDHPWVKWASASVEKTMKKAPVILPNLGGSLPNDVFSDVIGMPTIWVPHSYAACSQHAPNEHVLAPIMREGLQMMTGLFWDMGEGNTPVK
ncbi:M20 family metallopeptidase [Sneathiella marina]|uniref:M20 family metallopeptidase n=1 Tax=Sneathiella marina TaxID=2950108 RepID=A0ABY4W5X9_9PROT|nr:M20 family metallopeptidase [Sneathiella marina]USG62595.1 M20 family metallopeptidase [Sneathiella marina]